MTFLHIYLDSGRVFFTLKVLVEQQVHRWFSASDSFYFTLNVVFQCEFFFQCKCFSYTVNLFILL